MPDGFDIIHNVVFQADTTRVEQALSDLIALIDGELSNISIGGSSDLGKLDALYTKLGKFVQDNEKAWNSFKKGANDAVASANAAYAKYEQQRAAASDKRKRAELEEGATTMGILDRIQLKISQLDAQRRAIGANSDGIVSEEDVQRLKEISRQMGILQREQNSLTNTSARAATGVSNLQFSFSQLIREVPSGLYGINTLVLAMSNNIPILLDDIAAARLQGESVSRALGRAIFSITGGVTLAIAAFQLLSGVISNMSKEADEAQEALGEVSEELGNIREQGLLNLTKETEIFTILLKASRKDLDGHNQALKEIKKTYSGVIGEASEVRDINKKIENSILEQIKLNNQLKTSREILEKIPESFKALDDALDAGTTLRQDFSNFRLSDAFIGMDAAIVNSSLRAFEQLEISIQGTAAGLLALRKITELDFIEAIKQIKDKDDYDDVSNFTDLLPQLLRDIAALNRASRDAAYLSNLRFEGELRSRNIELLEEEIELINEAREAARADGNLTAAVDAAFDEKIAASRRKFNAELIAETLESERARLDAISEARTAELEGLIRINELQIDEAVSNNRTTLGLRLSNAELTYSLLYEERQRQNREEIRQLDDHIATLELQADKASDEELKQLKSLRELRLNLIELYNQQEVDESIKHGAAMAAAVKKSSEDELEAVLSNLDYMSTERSAAYQEELAGLARFGFQWTKATTDNNRRVAIEEEKEAQKRYDNAVLEKERLLKLQREGALIPSGEIDRASTNINRTREALLVAQDKLNQTPKKTSFLSFFMLGSSAADMSVEERKIALIHETTDAYQELSNIALQALSEITQAEIESLDRQINARQNNMDYAVELAKRGNTELLNEERNALQRSLRQREEAAQKQILINTLLATSEAVVGVAKAVSQGDPYSAVARVIAAVASLAAGYVAVTNLTRSATSGFHDGGYTGDGNEHTVAGMVHKGEVVFSKKDVSRLGGVQNVEAIRLGKTNIESRTNGGSNLKKEFGELSKKVEILGDIFRDNKFSQDVTFDENGISLLTKKVARRDKRRFV